MKLVWLRRDLRSIDNTALIEALNSEERVVAAYIATPETWAEHNLAPIQADLIYRRLFELRVQLQKLNVPLLYAEVGTFEQSIAQLQEWSSRYGVAGICWNKEYEINESRRDKAVKRELSQNGIDCTSFDDKCLLAPGAVLNKQNEYFKVFTPFKRAYLSKLSTTHWQVSKPSACVSADNFDDFEKDLLQESSSFSYPRVSSSLYDIDDESILAKLRLFERDDMDDYKKQRDFPSQDGTSGLSPYLAIGALSVRQCFARLAFQQALPLSEGRETWQSELIWREFYQHLLHFEPKLSCGESFSEWGSYLIWSNETKYIEAWKNGLTGYPIVDAAMRQLNQTGWLHNRLRMIVASFLVKDLLVDWRIGEAYFMNHLVDGDYAANNGGWQWCASTGCDGQPYFRIFNPITQGEKFDPTGVFVRRWIPELAEVPDKYVHQPWKWDSVKALSYPTPIVDHKVQREITLANYKNAKDVFNAT
tara:strand:+ start:922 stop:2349 length:1428 start_codon:yes stop_codon:yes gene_type:complete